MQTDIKIILNGLKRDKSSRTQRSLDKLNALLEKRFSENEKDFSIMTIAKASKASGGIGEVSIRNASGIHFQILIDAWATKAQTTIKKPPVPQSKKNEIPSDVDLLKNLKDPALRAAFGQIIAEKKTLMAENRILKQNAEVVIDMRPTPIVHSKSEIEILPALKSILVPSEIEALKDAIAMDKIVSRRWTVSKLGAVKDENDHLIFKTGFILAIQKILAEI